MRLVAKGVREMRWGSSFWLFAARYYLMPWYGWRASLSMKWDAVTPAPLSFRISHPVVNYALLVFQTIMVLLWVRAIADGEWALVVILPFPMITTLTVMLFRLQTVFKFSRWKGYAGG